MHVSSRPIRPLPAKDAPAPPRRERPPILMFVLAVLLAMAATILVSERDGGSALHCAELSAACGGP